MSAKAVQLSGITPGELADRCRRHPATDRVEETGTQYQVYPKDKTRRPVFFSRFKFGSSGMCENTLRDLRRSGIDVERPPTPDPKPTPIRPKLPTTPTTEDPVSAPARPTPHAPLMDRREGAELRDMVRLAVEGTDSVVSMMAEAEKRIARAESELAQVRQTAATLTRRVDAQAREIAALRSGGTAAPSMSEQIREVVLAYLVARPGEKTTPQVIELNLAEKLPKGRGKTMVAQACKDLATAGKIQGGGTRNTPHAARGVYWYEAPAEES